MVAAKNLGFALFCRRRGAAIKKIWGNLGEGIEKTYENANTLFSLSFLAGKYPMKTTC
tara:strand:+ start:22319 stop:22492 length:174 start_codon:yes stop_codon:yes gene_type:complete